MEFPFLAPPHCLLVVGFIVACGFSLAQHLSLQGPAVPGLPCTRLPASALYALGYCATSADVGRGTCTPALSLRRPSLLVRVPVQSPWRAQATWPSPSALNPGAPAACLLRALGTVWGGSNTQELRGSICPTPERGDPGMVSPCPRTSESGGWDPWGARRPWWVQETRLCVRLLLSW